MKFATERGTKPASIKTRFVPFSFPIKSPEYASMAAKRAAQGAKLFRVIATADHMNMGDERYITLETTHIFGNQWNTTCGLRVFNWFEDYLSFKRQHICRGHYLEVDDEMRTVCANTHKCGYCGAEYYGPHAAGAFCSACLDSPYLKETELHLLRLAPVLISGDYTNRAELTDAERAVVLPAFVESQTVGTASRAVAARRQDRERIEKKHADAISAAEEEYKGFIWLLDRKISIENVIYYAHTRKFCFGFLSPIEPSVKASLLDQLDGFPGEYEIK